MKTLRMAGLAGLACSLALLPAHGSGVGHSEREEDGRQLVTISNGLYRLTFDPARGGRCSAFVFAETGLDWVYDGKTGGLFQDHFAHQRYPGELLESAYEYAVEQDADRTVTIRLWTVAKGGREGRDALTRGLKVEKSVTLRAGRRDVEVVNGFVNPTAEGKNVGLWVQQCFCVGGERLFDLHYRPSTHGIHLTGRDDTGHHPYLPVMDRYSADFVGAGMYTDAGGREPVAGWIAGRDRRNHDGAVFLLDYNYLDVLYNCSGAPTTEWWLDKVPLPPGKSWRTTYRVIPVSAFTGFTHCSSRLIANTTLKTARGKTRVTHQFAGAWAPPGALTVSTRMFGVRSKKEATLPVLRVADIGLEAQTITQTWDQPQTEPVVVRVAVKGPDWEERYEYLFDGEFAGTGIAGAGEVAEYTVPRPAKQKVFLKPDSWERPRNAHLRVLLLYGLYSHHYRVEEAIHAVDPAAEIVVSVNWNTFPATYDELLGYDLIVLSHVPVGPDYANVMTADVVRHGGLGLLALGGIATFGGGQWQGTGLADVLPGRIPSGFDLQRAGNGLYPQIHDVHPALRGVRFPAEARVYWANVLEPAENAAVVMEGGDAPLALAAPLGRGRVLAVTASCHGEPVIGETAAWKTEAWVQMLAQGMKWLCEGE